MRSCSLDLPEQARLNVDETGHKRNGQRHWTWCFRAGLYTLFKIDPTPQRRRADRGPGGGVRRGAGLRLLLGLSPLPSRVRRRPPVLSGAHHPNAIAHRGRSAAIPPARSPSPPPDPSGSVGHGFAGSGFSRRSGITWRISSVSSPTMTRSISNCKIRCFSARRRLVEPRPDPLAERRQVRPDLLGRLTLLARSRCSLVLLGRQDLPAASRSARRRSLQLRQVDDLGLVGVEQPLLLAVEPPQLRLPLLARPPVAGVSARPVGPGPRTAPAAWPGRRATA